VETIPVQECLADDGAIGHLERDHSGLVVVQAGSVTDDPVSRKHHDAGGGESFGTICENQECAEHAERQQPSETGP